MATFEAMAWNDPKWADDRGNVERAFAREYPTKTLDKSSVHYLVYQSGASNKFHVFFLAQDSRDKWFAYNAYARIGYNPRLFEIGGPFSSKAQAESMISKKMGKKISKGYNQAAESFGAESSDTCSECNSELEYGNDSLHQCSNCGDEGCESCMESFCGDCDRCDDCCECKCSVCGYEDWNMNETEEGNVCRSCARYCAKCYGYHHPEGMAMDRLCKGCAEDMPRCANCGDYRDHYDTLECDECGDIYCENCEYENTIRRKGDDAPVCNYCADRKSAEELSVKEPFQTGFKVTLGVIAAGVVGTLGLGALGMILTGLGNGDE